MTNIKLDTIRRGIDISKKPDFGYYIWVSCSICGIQRWVTYLVGRGETKYHNCFRCSVSDQTGRRRRILADPALGSADAPVGRDMRYGQEIGKEVSTRYYWATCPRCGVARWVSALSFVRYPNQLCFKCSQRDKTVGRTLSLLSRHKISAAVSTFLNNNPEVRAKRILRIQSVPRRVGWHHTAESKRKIRESNLGENGANWRGGVSFIPYKPSFNNELKEKAFSLYEYKCYICSAKNGSRKRKHQVHHIDGDKHNDSLDNLMELCLPCHTSLHEWKRRLGLPSAPTGQALLNGKYRSEAVVL